MRFSAGASLATSAACVRSGVRGLMTAALAVLIASPVDAAPPPAAPIAPLGSGHLFVTIGQIDLDDAAAREWGVNREGFFALSGYRGDARRVAYFGGEFGHSGSGGGTGSGGRIITDFDLYWIEANAKRAFDLGRGWSAGAGLGSALFYVDGSEVSVQDGEEFRDPLADVGFGAQVFTEAAWRAKHLLMGVEVRYQWAFDLIDVDYSNFRLGVRLGVVF